MVKVSLCACLDDEGKGMWIVEEIVLVVKYNENEGFPLSTLSL